MQQCPLGCSVTERFAGYRIRASVLTLDPQFESRITARTVNWQLRADLWLWLGAPGRIRTCDTRFRKPMLYPLSYEG